jgi:hypothetical protein
MFASEYVSRFSKRSMGLLIYHQDDVSAVPDG